ncbi:sce7726 family protein, partial [Enterococcus faecalis]|nr:sce7726 family protein [Enterococcus faecalis]
MDKEYLMFKRSLSKGLKKMNLTDADIREALIQKLKMENTKKSYRIIEEFVICNGEARADVAIVNGIMKGFEIKSDVDSLLRLPNQIEKYDATFDKCTIVVGYKFRKKI